MFLQKNTGFFKNEDCPSSLELLSFQTGDIDRSSVKGIRRHLESCEFCAAEVEFYSHYPPAEGVTEPDEIPAALYELAEALLRKGDLNSVSLNELLEENSPLVADSV